MGKQFDDLSKAMARRISRGQALKGMVGGAVAAALAALIPGRTLAAGNADCAHFCNLVYGPGSWEAHACISQSARGGGPCYQFGPRSENCEYVSCPQGEVCVGVSVNYGYGNGYCYRY